MYYDYAMAAPLMTGVQEKEEAQEDMDVLILGMGTGTFATQCNRYFDNMNIEGVEIDDKITDLSIEYFDFDENIPVTTYDGRAYLNAIDKQYDVIMVDAYQDITIPFQMSSVEFFRLVADHLTVDGVMVVNMNMRGQSEGSINDYLSDTIASVFDDVYVIDVRGSSNRELYASNSPAALDRLHKNLELTDDENLAAMMRYVESGLSEYEAGEYLMTDDKAPVELLGMRVMDELIESEIRYYKQIFEEEGLQGVLDSL